MDTEERAQNYVNKMVTKGVNVSVLQKNIIRLRPALIFGKDHADIFLQATEDSLREIS